MERVLVSVGEYGWDISKVGPLFRKKTKKEPIHVMCYRDRLSLFRDYAKSFIPLPKWVSNFSPNCFRLDGFKEKHLDKLRQICYNTLKTDKIQFLVPYKIYGHCNKGVPKSDMEFIVYQGQEFHYELVGSILNQERNIIIWPRKRQGSGFLSGRNWSESNWNNLVRMFVEDKRFDIYNIIALGISKMSSLTGLKDFKNYHNFISYIGEDYTGFAISMLAKADLAIGSQSAGPILSMHTKVPTIMFGQEKRRHAIEENIWNVNVSFFNCQVGAYNSISPEMVFEKSVEMLG